MPLPVAEQLQKQCSVMQAIDESFHSAYATAIGRAQHFIHIETSVACAPFTAGRSRKSSKHVHAVQTIDKSIHSAYVAAIRRAQHFIYIENQYFLGSSHCWSANRSVPCRHLIPLEIALKIVAKINQGERFAAYIVLPMYSEGMIE